MKLGALVVGLGQIGMGYDLEDDPQEQRVASLARAFAEHDKFNLVAGVDSSAARRELFKSHYVQPVFPSVADALEEIAPSVVAIAVPTEAHYQVLHEVIQAPSVKAILCEKPLSYSLDEAMEMVQLAACSGVHLYTNYMRRCDSAVVEVKRRLLHGEIVGPIKGVCWYSKGLFNNGSHFFNLMQFWLGDMRGFKIIDQGYIFSGHDPEPDFKVQFESGEVYFHAACEENFTYHSVELVAANGRLRYDNGSIKWQPAVADSQNIGYIILSSSSEFIESNNRRIQWHVVDQISNDLAGKVTSICTGAQGLSTIKGLDQIRQKL